MNDTPANAAPTRTEVDGQPYEYQAGEAESPSNLGQQRSAPAKPPINLQGDTPSVFRRLSDMLTEFRDRLDALDGGSEREVPAGFYNRPSPLVPIEHPLLRPTYRVPGTPAEPGQSPTAAAPATDRPLTPFEMAEEGRPHMVEHQGIGTSGAAGVTTVVPSKVDEGVPVTGTSPHAPASIAESAAQSEDAIGKPLTPAHSGDAQPTAQPPAPAMPKDNSPEATVPQPPTPNAEVAPAVSKMDADVVKKKMEEANEAARKEAEAAKKARQEQWQKDKQAAETAEEANNPSNPSNEEKKG